MAVTNFNQILEWFKTGKKPTQAQFWASWGSFWHKHEGVVVKHPTQADIDSGLRTLEVLTNQGNIKIPTAGTYGGTMQDLKDFISNSTVAIQYRDLPYGSSHRDYCDNVGNPPVTEDKFFHIGINEIVIFKEATKSDPTSQNYDGWELYLFRRTAGKYGLAGPEGSINHTTGIQPITTNDFIRLDKSIFSDDVLMKRIGFNSLFTYYKQEDFSLVGSTTQQAFDRIFRDGMSKLHLPKLEFFWGLKPYAESGLKIRDLGVKIPFWQNIQEFRAAGGKVYLELWRRKETKRPYTSIAGIDSDFRPDGWYFESRPDMSGRINSIEVLNGSDYYKFSFYDYFSGHRRNHKNGKFPSDTDGNSSNKRTFRKAHYGFRLRFEGPGVFYRTPILGEIYCQVNLVQEYLSFKRI